MADNSDKQQTGKTLKEEKIAILGRLASTIAHDVRNPLGTINTSLFSIRSAIERNQPERVEKALKIAERNIKKCDNILEEFLSFTRKTDIRISPVNIDTFIKGVVEAQAIPESIECIRELNCDYSISIDPRQFRRAMVNIIRNAIQALKDDKSAGNNLTIHTSISDGSLIICVSDTGAGIPDDVCEKIYEPLYSTKRFGVGLGLTVAREIVEKHKGSINIESNVGSGTKVTIKIPADTAQ